MSDEQEYEARSVLVVVAHPDDAEFMAAATIGKWAQEGKEINYVLCTPATKAPPTARCRRRSWPRSAKKEQREACDRLGVKDLVFLEL